MDSDTANELIQWVIGIKNLWIGICFSWITGIIRLRVLYVVSVLSYAIPAMDLLLELEKIGRVKQILIRVARDVIITYWIATGNRRN